MDELGKIDHKVDGVSVFCRRHTESIDSHNVSRLEVSGMHNRINAFTP